MNKRVSIIRVIAGGYLVYLGVEIFRNMQVERPANYMLMYAASVIFVVMGSLFVITGLRPMLKKVQKEDTNEITGEESLEVTDESPEPDKSNLKSGVEEAKPKKAKSLRERAMLGNVNADDTQEMHLNTAPGDSGLRHSDTEKMPRILPDSTLQNTDVGIASEDIIAATEEIIATQESESAIVNINSNGSEAQPVGSTTGKTLDDGFTKIIK